MGEIGRERERERERERDGCPTEPLIHTKLEQA
jgi:hypothetical protein